MMRLLFVLLCLFPATCFSGHYSVSKGWPTGIRTDFNLMREEDRPLCNAFAKALNARGSLDGPLACERPIEGSREFRRARWTTLEEARIFPLAQRLELLLYRGPSRDSSWVESEAFRTNVRKRIAAGELSIALATVPAKPDGGDMLLLRYQRMACDPSRTDDYGRVVFLSADSETLDNLQPLRGLGFPTDVFMYNERAYFDSRSHRTFDDSFTKRLPKEQPVIYVHRMFNDEGHIRVCRLLYRD